MRVRYTRTAVRQIDAALEHLKGESPKAARGLQQRILSVVALLQTHPYSGRVTSKRHIRRFWLRSYPYLLDYVAHDDEIEVRRFRHASRRPLP